jgi:hypothetical protein
MTNVDNEEVIVLPAIDISKRSTIVGAKKIANKPKHPQLPIKRSEPSLEKNKKIEAIVESIINEPVHRISLNQLTEISPVARSRIKSKITKPHAIISKDNEQTVLIGESRINLPKGKSAPRTFGKVNGITSEIILDGGCTSFIISLDFAKQLGLKELAYADTPVMFGDGNFYKPIGLAKNLRIKVGDSETISVDALCFDVQKRYDVIVGREGLHALRIGTDWATHFWYINSDNGVLPFDVHYTKDNKRIEIDSDESEYNIDDDDFIDDEDSEEGFLIMEASDSEDENDEHNDPEKRLGEMIGRIEKLEDIDDEEKKVLTDLIFQYKHCFGTEYKHLSQTNLVKFHVDTGNAKPIYKRPYAFLSNSEKQLLRKELEEMVNSGILIPSTHAPGNSAYGGWSFPCRFVPKKTGDKRLVTNFKELNAVTVRDPWPLPNLIDVIESLAGAKWYAVLDLLKAFQQIAVEEASIPKLTITTPWGNYSYRCVPFGVLNGPSCFSRCIFLAIQPFMDKFATCYLDDVTLYSENKIDHMKHIEMFLKRMNEVNLKIHANKTDFFQKEITLLGFKINQTGVSPSPSKIAKILQFPRPLNETGIRAFVNLCGFYRRHIPGFADIAAPMNELLKKRNPFIWDEVCEKSFVTLKESLGKAATLVIPDANTRYHLYTDASEVGIGACLAMVSSDGEERPVLFLSRKLQPAETRYPVVEKELLAVIYSLKKLRKYLLDRKFVLFCDNSAVCYLFNKNEPSQRLQRWIMCTQEYTFVVKHLPSSKNSVADALSRFPPREMDTTEDGEDLIDALFDHLLVDEECSADYEDWLNQLVYYFKFPGNPNTVNAIKRLSLKYYYQNNKLYRRVGVRFVLVPIIYERSAILNEVHEGHGHFGINASWSRLYKDYWWPQCYEDMKYHVRSCRECQLFSPSLKNPATMRVPIHYLFEQFSIDFVGPLPKSNNGNIHILVAIENFSRWPVAIAVPNTEAKTVSNFLYTQIFCNFGLPTHLISDNGSSFDNEIIDNFLNLLQVHHKFTSPYRPSTNGRNEQLNGTITKALKKLSIDNPTDWDEHLPAVLYAYRTKAHSVLKMSPYEFMFGISPPSSRQDPLQLLGRALGMERLTELNDRNVQIEDYNVLNEEYDFKQVIKRKVYAPGTKVVRVRHNKFSKMDSHYKPEIFTVVSSFNNGTCQLADAVGRLLKRRVNLSSLRQIYQREVD